MKNNLRIQNKIDVSRRPEEGHARIMNYAIGREFSVRNEGEIAEIVIYDTIGDYYGEGVSAKRFRNELNKITASTINVFINSPGGDVFDGIAIYNDLKGHKAHINVHVTALAASAASLIAMAGDTIHMAENALLMIHNAWVMAMGDKQDLQEVATLLSKIDGQLAKTYAERSGISEGEIATMMNETTWMDADEAQDMGFIDQVTQETEAKAAYDVGVFAKTPSKLKQRVEAVLREAGYSKTESKAAVNKGFHVLGQREAGEHTPRTRREAVDGFQSLMDTIDSVQKSMNPAA